MRKTSTRAIFQLYDTSASQDGVFTANDILSICDLSNLDDKAAITTKYATLENDGFSLDGSCSIMTSSMNDGDVCYWSESMSKSDGTFDINPFLERIFSNKHSSAGITLIFDPDYPLPLEVRVSLFDENDLILKEGVFNPDSFSYFCDLKANDYKRVEIEFIKVEPYSYARLKNVEYGITLEYSSGLDKGISKASLLEEIDITSTTVSINSSSLTVIDHEETFNVDNPQGYYSLLQQKQKVQIFETIDDIEYEMATHYLKSWETESGVISTFKCHDILGVMDGSEFYGNVYEKVQAGIIIDEIMTSFGWTDYYVDPDVRDVILSGIIKPMSHRAALQQVVFAACGVIDTSRISGINIYKPSHSTTTLITGNRKFMSPAHKITQTDLITDVEVTAHRYVLSDDKKEVYKATLTPGIYELSFNQPSQGYSCVNCTLLEDGHFKVKVSVPEQAEVALKAFVYEDNTVIFRKTMDELPAGMYRKTKKIQNATLVSEENAVKLSEHLYKYYQYRLNHELKIICEDEKVGNYSAVKTKNNMVSIVFSLMDIDLTGGFLAKCKGIGYALKISDVNYASEIYSGDEFGVI